MKKHITPTITNRESEMLRLYLKDISKYPLLTIDEEVELSRRVKAGDKAARERMINGNLRFVITVAKLYQGRGVEMDDLIEEGNIGLSMAVERFDETMGFKFSTYAVHWIEQTIRSAIVKHGRTVRLPSNKMGDISKINKVANRLEQKLFRTPTEDEIAEGTGMDVDHVRYLICIDNRPQFIDAPVGPDSETTMQDFLPAEGVSADRDLIWESNKLQLDMLLDKLPEREAQIVRMLFGIDQPREYTESEVGEALGLSRERVRQIKERAMCHLKKAGSDFQRYAA